MRLNNTASVCLLSTVGYFGLAFLDCYVVRGNTLQDSMFWALFTIPYFWVGSLSLLFMLLPWLVVMSLVVRD